MGTAIRQSILLVRGGVMLLLLVLPLSSKAAAAKAPMDQARALRKQGNLKAARDLYRLAAEAFRLPGDQRNLAAALSEAGDISVSLGDYQEAIEEVEQSVTVRQGIHDDAGLAVDFNTIGLAYESLGRYPAALDYYQRALKINRMLGNVVGEVGRFNNVGNIYFFQARYMDALQSYRSALALVDANKDKSWNAWGRKLTIGNIATLYQRLGLEEQALDLYQQISGRPEDMAAAEYAQILLNEGVLYRHLGDPVKALEVYRSAQAIFQSARSADGEIRALRNVGIVKAMDLNDLAGALQAFTQALHLSRQSSNARGVVQASLYAGELLRRLHRYKEATGHLEEALASAEKTGLVEERWKSLYALGRIAEATGSLEAAEQDYRQALGMIESVRAVISATSLKIDFLADKRDVYDSLISFELHRPRPSIDELFQWMERSRARTLQDRVSARTPLIEPQVRTIQAHLPPHTLLLELWMGAQESVALWMTSSNFGMARYGPEASLLKPASQVLAAIQKDSQDWKQPSRELGAQLLAGLPSQQHMIVVEDGPLNIPFEVLGVPGSDHLLIEESDVSYLPSARLIAMSRASRRWLWPWNRELVAIGNPPVSSADQLAQNERWQPLPASADEVRAIARMLPGRSETHLGTDALKAYLLDRHLEGVPLLHLSTHVLVDPERPERSRILLASTLRTSADYLFQGEVNNLDLKDVGLVTLSSCDTARGKMVAGEGIQAFSQSFLAAGAFATVTSLWKVADEPAADFMKQFYYSLAGGASKAEALRTAKLRFLHSDSALSHPRYWGAFIITGDGWDSVASVVPWGAVLLGLAAAAGTIGMGLWRTVNAKAAKTEPRKELQFR